MKKVLLMGLCGVLYGQSLPAQEADQKKSVLYHVEKKIAREIGVSFMNKDITTLNQLQSELYRERKDHSANPGIYNYWLSYIDYFKTVVFLKDAPAEAEDMLQEGIKRLEDTLPNRNSEDQALLAMLKSLSISFNPGIKAGVIAREVEARCHKAIDLDKNNPRPYAVLGSSDYYTPPMYGGQKRCEEYLLKALALKDQVIPNPYLPSWGRELAYELLIKFYLEKKQKEKAKEYFKKAQKEYPDSYTINMLARQLID